MTDDKIALRELLEKGSDATLLRELIEFPSPDMPEDEDEKDDERERSIPLNTGIAVVLPATYVIEAITDPNIMAMRKAATKQAREAAYVPDFARPAPAPSVVAGPEADGPPVNPAAVRGSQ